MEPNWLEPWAVVDQIRSQKKVDHVVWNIDPIAFSLGPIHVRYYGMLFATAFLGGFYLLEWMYRREGRDVASLDTMLMYMVFGTLLGARLAHCFFYEPEYYLENPAEIIKFWQGGLASHGGGVGILIALYIYTRRSKENYLWLLSRTGVAIAMGGVFIRLGNFFNSEILGVPTDLPWAIIFSQIDMLPRHPTQLYESLAYLLIFAALFYKYCHGYLEPRKLLGLFLVLVFSARVLIEFTKTEQAAFELGIGLSMGQLLSIPFVVAGVVLLFKSRES